MKTQLILSTTGNKLVSEAKEIYVEEIRVETSSPGFKIEQRIQLVFANRIPAGMAETLASFGLIITNIATEVVRVEYMGSPMSEHLPMKTIVECLAESPGVDVIIKGEF